MPIKSDREYRDFQLAVNEVEPMTVTGYATVFDTPYTLLEGEDFRMLIISDHKTLTSTRGHDADPVPFIIYDSRENSPGSGLAYTETNGLKGPMIPEGTALLGMLFEK